MTRRATRLRCTARGKCDHHEFGEAEIDLPDLSSRCRLCAAIWLLQHLDRMPAGRHPRREART